MTNLEYTFDEEQEARIPEGLMPGGTISAVRLLGLFEQTDVETLKATLETITENAITLDISTLPRPAGTGEAAARLHLEEQLVKTDNLYNGLEEGDPLKLYLQEITALAVFGDPEVLAQQLSETDETLTYRLADLMLSRVIELAKGYVGRGVLLLDLIQEASLGLWQSIQMYRTGDKEKPFLPYCDWWLRQYLAMAVTIQAKAAGVGERLYRAAEDYRAVDEKLLTELGRNPTLEEMAEGLHMPVGEIAAVAEMMECAKVLQQTRTPEEQLLPEEEDQAVEDTAYFQMRQRIAELLSGVSAEDAELLTLRYGLEGGKPMTPQQVGARMGITAEQVINREAAALSKIRQQN